MANKKIFGFAKGASVPPTDTTNAAGGRAYALSSEEALAQLAATGTFSDTYYGTGEGQLEAFKKHVDQVSPIYIAQCALYARQKAGMKDAPAALTAMLTKADPALADLVFERVIDNGKQLRNYVQMVCSGKLGRNGFSGSTPKRLVARWINARTPEALLQASVGQSPSLGRIIRLAHPKPANPERAALYAYLRGHDAAPIDEPILREDRVETKDGSKIRRTPRYRVAALPAVVQHLERFKRGETDELPPVDFRFLAGLPLTANQWAQVARRGRFIQTFKNLNTYARHGVFDVSTYGGTLAVELAAKLRNADEIRQARVFPHQLLAAYLNTETPPVPFVVRDALQDAMEIATEKVGSYGVPVAILCDVSGSMSSAITGVRKGATSKVRAIDVAALISAVVLRRNPGSIVVPVDTMVHPAGLNPRDSVMTLAARLASFGGGGTDLGAGMAHLNKIGWKGGLVLLVSDNEAWVDSVPYGRGTSVYTEFLALERHNRGAKLVCLNVQPSSTTQASSAPNVLNIGGFSDAVFDTIGRFVRGEAEKSDESASAWVAEIKAIDVRMFGVKPSLTETDDTPEGEETKD